MAPEDACSSDMLVLIRWHNRTVAAPLSQLAGVEVDESPPRRSATGTTGWRKATVSDLRIYASLPKAQVLLHLLQHRHQLLLVVRFLGDVGRHNDLMLAVYRRLSVVAL